jgi:hypothetical protein
MGVPGASRRLRRQAVQALCWLGRPAGAADSRAGAMAAVPTVRHRPFANPGLTVATPQAQLAHANKPLLHILSPVSTRTVGQHSRVAY